MKKGQIAINASIGIIILIAFFLFIIPFQERYEFNVGLKSDLRGEPKIDYVTLQKVKTPIVQLFETRGVEGQYAIKIEAYWVLPVYNPIHFSEERFNLGIGKHSFIIPSPKEPLVDDGTWMIKAELYSFKNSEWVKMDEKETGVYVADLEQKQNAKN